MKIRTSFMVMATWAVMASVVLAGDSDQDGFQSLFNGKDLSQWVVMGDERGWSVKDGVIHSDGSQGGEWLRSVRQYEDFIFRVDWKVSKDGNSGVFIRSTAEGKPWKTGYEVQISNQPRDDSHCTGSLYAYAAVNPRPDESADEWHTFEITCRGDLITVVSDGVECVRYDQSSSDRTKDKPKRAYIGLQDSHSPEGHYIEYRNIMIKPLASSN